MPLQGKTLLHHVVERAWQIKGVDKVVLNVPQQDLSEFSKAGFDQFHGIENQEADVLGSYLLVAREEKADIIMRLTGDCPLLDPFLCERVLAMFKCFGDPLVYCANDTVRSGFPDGTDCEVFSLLALQLACEQAKDPFEREHVTPWLRRVLPNYSILTPYGVYLGRRKWSVDDRRDYETVCGIYSKMAPQKYTYEATCWAEDAWRQEQGEAT